MTERSSSESSTSSISISFDTSATTTTTFKTKTLSSSLSTIKKSLSQRRKSDSAASKSKIPKKKRRPISLVTNKTAVEIDSSMENSYNNKRSTKSNFFSKKKSSVIVEEPPQPPIITSSLNITTDSLSSSSEPSPQSSSEPSSQTSSEPTSPTIPQHPKSSFKITNSASETSETSNNNNSSQQTKSSSTTSSNSASETSEPPETSTNSHMEITTFLAAPRLTQRVRLSSGRVVSFSEVGDRNGFPVFVFLGMGCVRYFIAFFDDLATSYNLRLICPDRPGIGLSDDVKAEDQQVLKWPDVIDELCNIMEIPKFFIMAHSAGAPYALACAMKIPQRLQGTIYLVSPWVSTTVANNFKWLQYVPTPIIRFTNSAGISLQQMKHGRQPYSIKPQSQRNSGALAAQMSSNEKKQQLGLAILKASFAENLAGANNDLLMCFERKRTFGFSYTDVKHPVHVFHGTKDDRIPISAVKWMKENMSNCNLTLIEGGKHSLFLKAEVVDSIFKSIAVQLHDRENCRLCKIFSKCWLMEEAENSRKEREIEIQRRVVESFKSVKRKQSINDTSNDDSDKERKLEIQRKVVDSFKENVKRNQTINMMKTGTSNIILDHQRSSTDKISQNGAPVYTYI